MTLLQSLLSFILAAGLLTLTPGLDTALVLRTAMAEGPARAWLAGMGVIGGCLLWGGTVALGLGALLTASKFAFLLLKAAGVAYLLWLGLHLLLRPRTRFSVASAEVGGAWTCFRRGLLQNLLNPKVGVFYVSFLPQFVPPSVPLAGYVFLLAVIHGVLILLWFSALIAATRRLAGLLARPAVLKTADRLTGCMFLGFGAKLAFSRG
jgi:threonine/homoserine/homoserine lactone efflux protein